ncbi:MAG: GNAT family N-acetyltransferase [Caulobacteraceae bacterium]|nr:GNAT family N-acetyltransferase [Caulobacteraceae bacterium]
MNVEIVQATVDRRPLIEGLFQFYAYDFSEFAAPDSPDFEVDEAGRFAAYAHMDAYWRDPACVPLLITADGRAAGFALVNDWSPSGLGVDRAMAEFFIRRKYRRAGLGGEAVRQVLALYPGWWEIAVAARNTPALAFWPRAVAALDAVTRLTPIEGDGVRWRGPILRFLALPAAGRSEEAP